MGDDDDLALAHVESCMTCQAKLKTISQSGMTWNEVSDLLRPDETSRVAELAKSFGPGQSSEVMSLAYSSDGQMLAVAGAWDTFQIWKRTARISGRSDLSDLPNQ